MNDRFASHDIEPVALVGEDALPLMRLTALPAIEVRDPVHAAPAFLAALQALGSASPGLQTALRSAAARGEGLMVTFSPGRGGPQSHPSHRNRTSVGVVRPPPPTRTPGAHSARDLAVGQAAAYRRTRTSPRESEGARRPAQQAGAGARLGRILVDHFNRHVLPFIPDPDGEREVQAVLTAAMVAQLSADLESNRH